MTSSTELAPPPEAGLQKRETGLERRGETAAVAQAAQVEAVVKAQYLIAWKNPRNMEDVRTGLAKECSRPGFAEAARYSLPFKKWDPDLREMVNAPVEGFSIRFAEAAVRLMGNVVIRTPTIYDDEHKRIVSVNVIDLEANVAYSVDLTVEKVIERKKLKKGQVPIAIRKNSHGDDLFMLPASERDVTQMVNAAISKAIRTNGLRLVPADILEECERIVVATQAKSDAEDPDTARRKIVDGYAGLGIKAADLEKLLDHSLDSVNPTEMAKLRAYFRAIKDGFSTWPEVMACETDEAPEEGDDPHAELRKKVAEQLEKTKANAAAKSSPGDDKPSDKGQKTPAVEPSKPKGKKAAKKTTKKKAPAEAKAGEPAQAPPEPRTPEQIAEGWDVDPQTNEAIPPAGGSND